jgi:hypothetical protein
MLTLFIGSQNILKHTKWELKMEKRVFCTLNNTVLERLGLECWFMPHIFLPGFFEIVNKGNGCMYVMNWWDYEGSGCGLFKNTVLRTCERG